ncbi:MAG: peptidoglycan-binding domain-containing protein, partial [Patescibacteria group bacterium]
MKKTIIIPLLVSLALVFSANAQTSASPTVEDLQKQIQLLLSQMSSLQKEITTLKSTPTAPTAPSISAPVTTSPVPSFYSPPLDESEVTGTESEFVPPPTLIRSLFRGSRGEDVRQLQEFLAQDPAIYPEGLATGYYGIGTEAAVKRWQAQNGVPAVGVVGRQTIAKFKQLYQGQVPPKLPVITDPDYPINPRVCAVYSPITCPAGEERYLTSDPLSYSSCSIYACRPAGTKKEICPALPT